MPVCSNIRGKKRGICIGDLDRLVTIENRAIEAPKDGVDYTEVFSDMPIPGSDLPSGEAWAMIESVSGETIFDNTNTERVVTHRIYLRYIPGITAQSWVTYEGIRYNVIDAEDLDARKEFIRLRCSVRGITSNSNNSA